MAKYIDKSALVAEIRKRASRVFGDDLYAEVQRGIYSSLEIYINEQDVKEVDLEEELESFAYTLPHSAIGDGEHLGKFDDPRIKEARKHGWSHSWRYNYVKDIAKHFFELGLKVQKGGLV